MPSPGRGPISEPMRKDAHMDAATRQTLIAQYKAGYDEIVKAPASALTISS